MDTRDLLVRKNFRSLISKNGDSSSKKNSPEMNDSTVRGTTVLRISTKALYDNLSLNSLQTGYVLNEIYVIHLIVPFEFLFFHLRVFEVSKSLR
jgi:hypothetical protein